MASKRTAALVLACLALPACRDVAAPAARAEALLAASASEPVYGSEGGQRIIFCRFHLELTVSGDEGGSIALGRTVLRFFAGPDRSVPVDTMVLAPVETSNLFETQKISTGLTRRAEFEIGAGLPFAVELEVGYRNGASENRTTTARAACGPEPSASGSAPALTGAALAVEPGDLEPGDSLTVSWKASSDVGLWETGVLVQDSPDAHNFFEEYAANATRSVRLAVPIVERIGLPLYLQAYAVDVLGRVTYSPILATPPVVDRTPPGLASVRLSQFHTQVPRGVFGVGDTLSVTYEGADNHRLAYLVMETARTRDSIRLIDQTPGPWSYVVPPEWADQGELRAYLRDEAGNLSTTVAAVDGQLWFHPVRSPSMDTLNLHINPEAVVHDGKTGTLWIASVGQGLTSYAGSPLAETLRVPLPSYPHDLDLAPSGDTLVAALESRLAVLDLTKKSQAAIVALDGVSRVFGVRISAAGEAVVLAQRPDGGIVLVGYHLASGAQRVLRENPPVPGPEAGVVRSVDRRRMVLGAGCVYDVAADAIGPCRLLPEPVQGGDRTGTRWVGHDIVYGEDLSTVMMLDPAISEWLMYASAAAISEDGAYAYFATYRGPLRVRVEDGRILEMLRTPNLQGGLTISGGVILGWGSPPGRYRMVYRITPP